MKLNTIKDNIKDGNVRVYHSTRSETLHEIIINEEFDAGSGYGAMLGKGFYCNLQLHQAQKGNYGPNVLMCEITTLDKFIFLEWEPFLAWFGVIADVDESNFIDYQATKFGSVMKNKQSRYHYNSMDYTDFSTSSYNAHASKGSSSQYASILNDNNIRTKCKKIKPVGFVYAGRYDGLSIVCWYPNIFVNPIAMSTDKGVNFEPVDNDEFKDKVAKKTASASVKFNRSGEEERSYQRAMDLADKYSAGSQYVRGVSAQLSKIRNQDKFNIRKQAFIKAWKLGKDTNVTADIEAIEMK